MAKVRFNICEQVISSWPWRWVLCENWKFAFNSKDYDLSG